MQPLKNNFYLFSVVIALFYGSCKKENMCDCIKRTGKIEKETRSIKGFNKIFVNNNVHVFITQDTVFEVEVEAGKNIIPFIITEVSDSTLIIKNNNRCNWARAYGKTLNVYVKMPDVKSITSNSSERIESVNTITANRLEVEIKSSGDIDLAVNNYVVSSLIRNVGDLYLHGTTTNHVCNVYGNSFLYAENLKTNYTQLSTHSTGICYINVSNKLDCSIAYDGDVYCYGNPPVVNKTDTDKGKLYLK